MSFSKKERCNGYCNEGKVVLRRNLRVELITWSVVFIHRESSGTQKPNFKKFKYPESNTKELIRRNLTITRFEQIMGEETQHFSLQILNRDWKWGLMGGGTYRIQLQNNMSIFDLIIS